MSFLTNKYGPLPAWGWGAAAGGAVIAAKMSKHKKGKHGTGGDHHAEQHGTAAQSHGSTPVTDMSATHIDGSFFGNDIFDYSGPMAIPIGGFENYVDVFPNGLHGRHRHHHRHHPHSSEQLYLASLGVHDRNWAPVGAGGIGEHHARWQGEVPPVGGEGFQNHGQSAFVGQRPSTNSLNGYHNGFKTHHGGGIPHPQITSMGTPLTTYLTQAGDSFDKIANKLWGPGLNGNLIQTTNPGMSNDTHSELPPGHSINIPAAPPVGTAPSGVAGNGVGAGANQVATRTKISGALGMHMAITGDQAGNRPKEHRGRGRSHPGKAGHKKVRG